MRFLWFVGAVAALTVPLHAEAQIDPKPLQDAVSQLRAACTEQGGTMGTNDVPAQTADLDGDGKKDYVLESGSYTCSAAVSLYGGSGGSDISIFLSSRGYRASPELTYFGYRPSIDRTRNPPRVVIPTKSGVDLVIAWNGKTMADVSLPPSGPRAMPRTGASSAREDWQVVKLNATTSYAQSRPVGFVESVLVECSRFGYRVSIGFRGHAPVPTIGAIFGIPSEPRIALTMEKVNTDLYATDVREPYLFQMLTEGRSSIQLTVDGRVAGNLSLAGSTRVIRQVLAKCLPNDGNKVGPPAAPLETSGPPVPGRNAATGLPWTVGSFPNGVAFAQSPPFGQIKSVMALCMIGKYRVAVWVPDASGRTMNAEFVGPAGPVAVRLFDQGGKTWSFDTKDARVISMLASGLPVTLRIEGQDMGVIPLDGANGALRQALAPCLKVNLPEPAQQVSAPRPGSPALPTASDLGVEVKIPMTAGYWVPEANKCSAPSFVQRYDGKHLWFADNSTNGYRIERFASVQERAPGRYRLILLRTGVNEEEGEDGDLAILSPTSISLMYDDAIRMRLCPLSSLPPAFR